MKTVCLFLFPCCVLRTVNHLKRKCRFFLSALRPVSSDSPEFASDDAYKCRSLERLRLLLCLYVNIFQPISMNILKSNKVSTREPGLCYCFVNVRLQFPSLNILLLIFLVVVCHREIKTFIINNCKQLYKNLC